MRDINKIGSLKQINKKMKKLIIFYLFKAVNMAHMVVGWLCSMDIPQN